MPVPIVYRAGSEANASYDWQDFISSLGYRRFYTIGGNQGGSYVYYLTNSVLDAGYYGYWITSNSNAFSTDFDLDVDNPFILGGGYAFINVTFYSSAVNGVNCTALFTIYHVNAAATETSLGSATITWASQATAVYWRHNLRVDLTKKSFAAGEKIRVSVDMSKNVAGALAYGFYSDPSSISTVTDSFTGQTIGTDLTLDLPFKIDI